MRPVGSIISFLMRRAYGGQTLPIHSLGAITQTHNLAAFREEIMPARHANRQGMVKTIGQKRYSANRIARPLIIQLRLGLDSRLQFCGGVFKGIASDQELRQEPLGVNASEGTPI